MVNMAIQTDSSKLRVIYASEIGKKNVPLSTSIWHIIQYILKIWFSDKNTQLFKEIYPAYLSHSQILDPRPLVGKGPIRSLP